MQGNFPQQTTDIFQLFFYSLISPSLTQYYLFGKISVVFVIISILYINALTNKGEPFYGKINSKSK